MENKPLIASKPVFQRFVEANTALLDCYGKISKDSLDKMSEAEMDSKCGAQKAQIRSILESNEMTMTQIVKDRTEIMYALNARGPMRTIIVESNDE